ncbi:hypothetical protein ACOMHN_061092 [Nucella lapillus]
MQEDCPISNPQKTPLGGGKRPRKQHCKKAIQARWKSKLADKQQAESTSTVGLADSDIQVHTVCGSGDAVGVCSRNQNLDGQDNLMQPEQRDNLSTARRKLGIMQEYVDAAGDTDQNKERCFLELGSLKKLFSSVTCPRCDASLNIAFGDKMGFSREIRIACEVMKHLGATPSADLQGYQARQNLKRFAQADVNLEPATKRSRKEHKRAAKTSKRGQERQEGQTYGSGMV